MQVQKREYKTYKFSELSEEAKEKAIEKLYDINVDYDWWDCCLEDIESWSHETYGINFDTSDVCFDLDRGSQFYVDAKHDGSAHIAQIWVHDYKKLGQVLRKNYGVKQSSINKLVNETASITIECKHYGGGDGANYADLNDYDNVLTDSEYQKIEEAVNDILKEIEQEALSRLRKEQDYLTSEEAIIDTIEANDYDFFEDGRMFTL
jgi:hypothetical protein